MPRHPDFERIYKRFVKQYGPKKGEDYYYAWINKKGYDDTKPFPGKGGEKKELRCLVRGLEIKETPEAFHVEGLISTSHIDNLDQQDEMSDRVPKETLESFANQMNTNFKSRVMGIHHSEGTTGEYFGEADIANTPARVIPLSDGEWGLLVDTKLLKNDPGAVDIANMISRGDLDSFSITYDTKGFETVDFDWVDGEMVRILKPDTQLCGYTASSTKGPTPPANPNAVVTGYGFKEFKELVQTGEKDHHPSNENKEIQKESKEVSMESEKPVEQPLETKEAGKPAETSARADDAEKKELEQFRAEKKAHEEKELIERAAGKIADGVLSRMEMKEKVLKDTAQPGAKETRLEVKELLEAIRDGEKYEIKEQFRRAAAVCDALKIDWREVTTSPVESREFKHFGVNGRKLEFKGLGITTNQNSDTDYLQSSAELQDVYDPVIYNALNQTTVTWNLLAKDDMSRKGNNQVQFTLKTAANTSAAFYTGNAVVTGNVTRLKYQTKFKKIQVGVTVDGDMVAAARGGPVSDVFAQEVMDSTIDMLDVLNSALFAEVGLETASAVIGFEYISDSAGNTTLYNLTRSTANKLAPAAAGDTYINQASTIVSMTNLRAATRQARNEGANKANLVFICHPVQADLLRGKFDDARRLMTARDTDFGFTTDLFVDGVPVFEDVDCNTDDWWLIDLETHRVAIWVPPTIERLGKTADSEDAYIKMYLAVYNRAPRRLVQIYGCATS